LFQPVTPAKSGSDSETAEPPSQFMVADTIASEREPPWSWYRKLARD
jgi:hypothetical protein